MSKVWVTGEGGEGHWMEVPDPSGVAPINAVSSGWSQVRTISMVNPFVADTGFASGQAPLLAPSPAPIYATTRTQIGTADANLYYRGGVSPSPNPVAPSVVNVTPTVPPVPAPRKDIVAKVLDPIIPGKQEDWTDFVPFYDSQKGVDIVPGSPGSLLEGLGTMAPLLLLGGLGSKRVRRKARRAVSYPNRKYRQVKSRRRRQRSVMARRRSRRR